jgi:transglutaminase-like putative cysteine protease
LIGWFAPGGASVRVGGWREPDGTKVERRAWATQAEQVAYLRAMVDASRERESMRRLAVHIAFDLYGCQRKEKTKQALALACWVQDHVTYVEELPERFYLPERLLAEAHPAGDCDDFTTLIASLCEAIGIPCRLVAASWRGGYRHIWPEAFDGKRWLRLDATMRERPGVANPYKALVAKYGDDAWVLRV